MRRLVLILCVALLLGVTAWIALTPGAQITVLGAQARPLPGGHSVIVTLDIVNEGAPDRLLGARAPEARVAMLKSLYARGVPVPGRTTASLVPEGAHILLMGFPAQPAPGTLLPLTLDFARAGALAVKAHVIDAPPEPAFADLPPADQPGLTLRAEDRGGTWYLRLDVRNFTFARPEAEAIAIPGTGHAHIYVDGIKIGRAYGPEYAVPPLPPGPYTVDVILSTNDHRLCRVGGQTIAARAEIAVTR